MISAKVVKEFEKQLPGRVLTAEHADFDRVRKVYNGMIDRRPALIARCRLKDIWDPTNFFCQNSNIEPGHSELGR